MDREDKYLHWIKRNLQIKKTQYIYLKFQDIGYMSYYTCKEVNLYFLFFIFNVRLPNS